MPRPPGSSSSYLASTSLPPVPISFVHGVLTAYTAMLLPSGRRTRDSLRKLSLFCAAITTDQTGSWEDPLVVARTLRLLALATQNERMPAPSVVKSCRYTTHYLVRKITAEAFEWNVAGGVCDKTKLAETLAGLPTSIRTLPIWTKIDDNLEPIYDVLAGFIALLQPSGRPTAEQIKQLYTFCSTINRDEQGPWADPVVVARTIRLLDLAITHEKPKPSAKRLCRSRRRDLVDKITAEGFVWDLQSREEGHKALFEDTIALLPEEIKTLPIWTKIDDQAWATPNPAQPLTSIPVPARPVASEEPLDPPRSTRTSPIQDLSISVRKKEDSSSFVPSNSAPAHPRQQLAQTAAEREAEGAAREWEIRQFFLQHRDLTAEHTQIALKDLLGTIPCVSPCFSPACPSCESDPHFSSSTDLASLSLHLSPVGRCRALLALPGNPPRSDVSSYRVPLTLPDATALAAHVRYLHSWCPHRLPCPGPTVGTPEQGTDQEARRFGLHDQA